MKETLELIQEESKLAFEEWKEKTGISKFDTFKIDSNNVQIITTLYSSQGEQVTINTYPFQNFFTYFEQYGIRGYAPIPTAFLEGKHFITYHIYNEISLLAISKKPFYSNERSECQIACIRECFQIRNKQIKGAL